MPLTETEIISSYKSKQFRRMKWFRIVGRRYEKHVARTLNKDGWTVHRNYRYKLHDHGFDLIAVKGKTERYVQCKARKQLSNVHVNTVYQLYGAVMANADNKSGNEVQIYIYTSSRLDPYASAQAEKLGVKVEHLDYPKWHTSS
jgi:Holliday junction resolvase-like predicted endonuclease